MTTDLLREQVLAVSLTCKDWNMWVDGMVLSICSTLDTYHDPVQIRNSLNDLIKDLTKPSSYEILNFSDLMLKEYILVAIHDPRRNWDEWIEGTSLIMCSQSVVSDRNAVKSRLQELLLEEVLAGCCLKSKRRKRNDKIIDASVNSVVRFD